MAVHVSHAALPYPVKGARYSFPVPLLDADGDPTAATTPDTEISKDNGAAADCAEEISATSGMDGVAILTLTGAEMDCSLVALNFKSASGPKATLMFIAPRVLPVIVSGTAQAGASGSITLQAGTAAYNLAGCIVRTTGGTGGGGTGGANNQARVITAFNTSTLVATVVPNWETNPSSDTTYEVLRTENSSPFMPAAAPATGGGLPILGANVTGSGGMSIANSAGDALVLSSGGGNGSGLSLAGNGSGHGLKAVPGATGNGINAVGGATSGAAVKIAGTAGNAVGLDITGQGSAAGLSAVGGATGNGGTFTGGATSGSGLVATGTGLGGSGVAASGAGSLAGITATAGATSGAVGIKATGAGTGGGIRAEGGPTGPGINCVGGATSGAGLKASGSAGNSAGFEAAGSGSSAGISATGGATGHGVSAVGGSTSGDGVNATVTSGTPVNASNIAQAAGLALLTGIQVAGTVAASPSPAVGGFDVTTGIDRATGFYTGAFCVITSGNGGVIPRKITSSTRVSATVQRLAFSGSSGDLDEPFPVAPASSDTVAILGKG